MLKLHFKWIELRRCSLYSKELGGRAWAGSSQESAALGVRFALERSNNWKVNTYKI